MFKENVSLLPYNTFGIDVKASHFSSFQSVEDLKRLLSIEQDLPIFVLGGGSNVLLTQDIKARVLKNEITGKEIVHEDQERVTVKVGAGENWHEFVLFALDKNWGGIENLSLIPGSVGASPMQNIGAYGVEIKDVFESLEALNLETLALETFSHQDCQFGYRESVFKRSLKGKYIITSVTYRLHKKHQLNTSYGAIEQELESQHITSPTIKDVSEAVIAIRTSKLPDPKEIGNAGSFFKNPVVPKTTLSSIQLEYPDVPFYPIDEEQVKLPAGWLIEKAGWKGKRFEQYGVHKKQALVLVNYGGAKGEDIYALSTKILEDVLHKFNVSLEREVNIV